ncbi:MAG: hypothetical protein HQK75_04250 [Candidatus Magnetomorum sp.]|nr:hypothetical protein [Candidatus Magnetomorum sp.]
MKKVLLSMVCLMSVSFFLVSVSVSSVFAGDPVKKDAATKMEKDSDDQELEEFEEPQVPEAEESMEYQQDSEEALQNAKEPAEDSFYEEKWEDDSQVNEPAAEDDEQ